MTRIYLIRHAEAEGNLYRIAQGQYDSLVTDRGHLQIQALEKRFQDIPVDAVYSSDLHRTCETAAAICRPHRLPLHLRPDLREICVGAWEQQTWGQIARDDPEQMANFSRHLDLWHVDGAETAEQVQRRVRSAVEEIAAANDGKTVALFSHGCAIRILLAHIEGYSIGQICETPLGGNTAVSLAEYDDGALRVVFRDDVSHLTPDIVRPRSGNRPKPLDPGLWFAPLDGEQRDWAERCTQESWADSAQPHGQPCPSLTASQRMTLLGRLEEEPVGLIQLDMPREAERLRGWMSLYCVERSWRCRGYGVQLLGQAVQRYRGMGRKTLCIALRDENETARRFFTEYGFHPQEELTPEGGRVWAREIAIETVESYG